MIKNLFPAKYWVIRCIVCSILILGTGEYAAVSQQKESQLQIASRQFNGIYSVVSHKKTTYGCNSEMMTLAEKEPPFRLKAEMENYPELNYRVLIINYMRCDYNNSCEKYIDFAKQFAFQKGEWIAEGAHSRVQGNTCYMDKHTHRLVSTKDGIQIDSKYFEDQAELTANKDCHEMTKKDLPCTWREIITARRIGR